MSGDTIDYDALLRRSLTSLVRDILTDAAENGLRGNHHYFVAFSTTHPDVNIPQSLREKHPKDMTIVLQNQFWDLAVGEDSFSVKLNFAGRTELLEIPFDALLGFLDPSVQFALPFKEPEPEAYSEAPAQTSEPEPAPVESNEDNVVTLDSFRNQR